MDINIETQFIKNTDVPSSYVGQNGKLVVVNDSEDGLDFVENPNVPSQQQTLEVLLMTSGNISFSPIYDNGVDGVGATLTATVNGILRDTSGASKIDGVTTPVNGSIIWVKDRPNQLENGAYEITDRGSSSSLYVLTRPEGYNEMPELYPLQVNVTLGVANKNTVWLQKTVDPVIGISPIVLQKINSATQSQIIRLIDTATSEPLPSYTFNPTTNIITFDSVGYFGELNGCVATLNGNIPNGFRTFLVKDEVEQEINGTYQWINVGSSVIAPSAVRLDTTTSQFSKNTRTFMISNSFSTLYGKQYFVRPTTPPLTTANLNTVPITFVEVSSAPTLQQVSDTGGLDNGSTVRQGGVDRFGVNGISLVCSLDKEIQFANGVEYYFPVGGSIVWANSMNGDTPDSTYDETQGFAVGSRYKDLLNSKEYLCLDATTDNAVWIPMSGTYEPTLDKPIGAVTGVSLNQAFYSINNGIVDVTIQGTVDVDFSVPGQGSFDFTLPIEAVISPIGNITFDIKEQVNGIIMQNVSISSNDILLIRNGVIFVAKFTYQAY